MPPHAGFARALLLVVALVPCEQSAPAQPAQSAISLKSAAVIENIGGGGRTLLQRDYVEAARVAGSLKGPKAGDTLQTLEGEKRWEAREAGGDGWLGVRPGGWAAWSFDAPAEAVMMLEASGHTMAFVNGEPRVGDPYELGYVRLPVLVKAGSNEILFKSSRGRVRATLTPPPAPLFVSSGDMTLPDLLIGDNETAFAGMVFVNASPQAAQGWTVSVNVGGGSANTAVETIPPLSVRKLRVDLPPADAASEPRDVDATLTLAPPRGAPGAAVQAPLAFKLGVRRTTDKHRRTFISAIDGSVQYFGVVPPPAGTDLSTPKALILSLHGASVEAAGQAACYKQRDWCYVIAPTNRRPFGFDWEDWGREDALEVLAQARARFKLDDRRTFLTGHSMGGHGTWNIGVQFPGTFAALGPSAGWISFWSYAGGANREYVSGVETMLLRATGTSDTLAMKRNFAQQGIYILHGDADDNVPVDQARTMRRELAEFHPNFAYYEQPGAGHWWGDQCVDWDPMIEFFRRQTRPEQKDIARVEFATVNPEVSPTCHWLTVVRQQRPLELSTVEASADREKRRYTISTKNVAELAIDTVALTGTDGPVGVEIDGKTVDIPIVGKGPIVLARESDEWSVRSERSAARPRLFKTAFSNFAVLVYPTGGTPEESARACAKARFDAETFWYRGNGDFRVMSDTDYLTSPVLTPEKRRANVILYGNADTNRAWDALVPDTDLRAGVLRHGGRAFRGDHTALLAIVPMKSDSTAAVGIVGSTGPAGARLLDRLPYFVSGVGVPDWVILTPELLTKGARGVKGAGFFGDGGTTDPAAAWQE